ncbi:MAG: tRNA (guanine(10)-N(2))-dimethyltransferase [Caldisphaeraceae archaeon]|nr:tRNA (guanine(10)-N(2))-dimethyltransferase [Caldisphaeraceae archaeon]MEB3692274.1 tRNA (guanine(10)-N(2))-dimethyltransferase [Caldisphaeraceae archaeon]MEB3798303.1 tRNA (guanine(10)-N(2))-dimethyltransferase [Caldisphaeraceae archaeon]
MELSVIKEGNALLYIPDTRSAALEQGIIEPTHLPVFYNPVMTFNRDLSVVVLDAFIKKYLSNKEVTILDPLAATGIRGIRYAIEIERVSKVIINDGDRDSYRLMKKNVKLNGLENVVVHNRDANSLMRSLRFECKELLNIIDLDPFGSVMPFIHAALSISTKGTMLAVTATDLAVLGGSKPVAAKRKYQASLIKNRHYRETSIRVLLAYIARIAASYDKVIIPLMSYSVDHYLRLYLLIGRGARRADKMIEENIGYFTYENGMVLYDKNGRLGPIWTGKIMDEDFLREVLERLVSKYRYLETYKRSQHLLDMLIQESSLQTYFHQRVDTICKHQHKSMPRMDKLIERINELNYRATRSTFSATGFRTDAPSDLIVRLCKESIG